VSGKSPVAVAAEEATTATTSLAGLAPAARATMLDALADAVDERCAALVEMADAETALGVPRLTGEVARTTHQLRYLAEVVRGGSYLGAVVDLADDDTPLGPVPDLRRMGRPIGPVAVFAASNFPFAFSVLGGDTASALAAGCPVIVKAHPGHPRLSVLTAGIARDALAAAQAPPGALALVEGWEAGPELVRHPLVAAVGFTGSLRGGRELSKIASSRPEPIPFFGELGSLNPVVVTPAAARERGSAIVDGFLASFTLGLGQFCTKPGLLFIPAGTGLVERLADGVGGRPGGRLLTAAIRSGLEEGIERLEQVPGVHQAAIGAPPQHPEHAQVRLYRTTAETLRAGGAALLEEHFGPVAVVVEYGSEGELFEALQEVPASLTFTVQAEGAEDPLAARLLAWAAGRAGRVVVDGWPTGVAVRDAMQHGGPFPASTVPSATSVGAAAMQRFLVPVCYQNVPDALLPPPLRNGNPWGVPRRVNGQVTTAPISPGLSTSPRGDRP
jgi:NADP-dependent aldehyde dehydrogenase